MTTYPLSELATIYAAGDGGSDDAVLGKGTLADCAEIVEGLSARQQQSARIAMDDLDLTFDSSEVAELLRFLRTESAGLSNQKISAIADPGR